MSDPSSASSAGRPVGSEPARRHVQRVAGVGNGWWTRRDRSAVTTCAGTSRRPTSETSPPSPRLPYTSSAGRSAYARGLPIDVRSMWTASKSTAFHCSVLPDGVRGVAPDDRVAEGDDHPAVLAGDRLDLDGVDLGLAVGHLLELARVLARDGGQLEVVGAALVGDPVADVALGDLDRAELADLDAVLEGPAGPSRRPCARAAGRWHGCRGCAAGPAPDRRRGVASPCATDPGRPAFVRSWSR